MERAGRSNRTGHTLPSFMNPVAFLGVGASLAILFALQEWIEVRELGNHIKLSLLLQAWGIQYLLWALICWILWWLLGSTLQRVTLFWAVAGVLPLSIAIS